MLASSTFKRPTYAPPRQPTRPIPALFKPPAKVSEEAKPVPKVKPVRSEAYRRLVAELPCISCGMPGPSQCAHANYGKGMGTKASDTESFPLCPECHRMLDQGGVYDKETRRALEQKWVAETKQALKVVQV